MVALSEEKPVFLFVDHEDSTILNKISFFDELYYPRFFHPNTKASRCIGKDNVTVRFSQDCMNRAFVYESTNSTIEKLFSTCFIV